MSQGALALAAVLKKTKVKNLTYAATSNRLLNVRFRVNAR